MKAEICPTCSCSIIRLEISLDDAVTYLMPNDEKYYFCCQGCLDMFLEKPQKYLDEIADLIVCPACLAEKIMTQTIERTIGGYTERFCRCPSCLTSFEERPDYFMQRLYPNYKEMWSDIKSLEMESDKS